MNYRYKRIECPTAFCVSPELKDILISRYFLSSPFFAKLVGKLVGSLDKITRFLEAGNEQDTNFFFYQLGVSIVAVGRRL